MSRSGAGIPPLTPVADGVWALGLANPPGNMPWTLTYFVRDDAGQVHLIDSGWPSEENVEAIRAALPVVGGGADHLTSIVVTHLHPDHLGLAERLREFSGAEILMHRVEQENILAVAARAGDDEARGSEVRSWGVPRERFDEVFEATRRANWPVVHADRVLDDTELLDLSGRRLRVLHTPGHTAGHVCLRDEDLGLLFTGDHVLPDVAPGVGESISGANPMLEYLTGLRRVCAFDDHLALPGHGLPFRGIADRARAIAQRHLRRTAEVANELENAPEGSAWSIASRLSWGPGWEGLQPRHRLAALRQTSYHADLVRRGHHEDLVSHWR